MSIRIDALERLVNEAYNRGYFSGCVLVAEKQKPIYKKALGIAEEVSKRPVNEESIFCLASVSKQFTAAAIMLLCQTGKLSLDDNMEKFFPRTRFHGRTIKNLLNHTCGLPDYMDWVDKVAQKEKYIPDNSIIELFLSDVALAELFAPGTRFAYSNTGYSALAYIIQKASGTTYGDFLRRKLFIPAGMENTQVCHIYQTEKRIDNYAYGYVMENGIYIPPEKSKVAHFAVTLDGIEGDGSVCSTVDDLLLWDVALKDGKIISKEIQSEMYTPTRYGEGEKQGYGYGWNMVDDPDLGFTVFHSGSWPGYSTEYIRFLDKDITLVVLMNRSGCDCRGRSTFIEGLKDTIKGKNAKKIVSTDDVIDETINIHEYEKYCGDYEDGIRLWIDNSAIYMSFIFRAETRMETRLYPAGNDLFVTYLAPQNIRIDDSGITCRLERKLKTYRKL